MKACSVEGCEKDGKSAGMCSAHYHRLKRYGDVNGKPSPKPLGVCAVEGCGRGLAGGGFCVKHYKRFRAHGDPLGGGINYGDAQRFVEYAANLSSVDECVTWPFGKNSEGRGRVNIGGKPQNADVAILTASKGEKPTPKHECCHSCGNGHLSCVNPGHMYWGTRKENVADAMAHGTAFLFETVVRHGEKAAAAKYSDQTISEIRTRIANGERQVDLAEEYGMSKTHINRIWKGLARVAAVNDNGKKEMAA